MANFETVTVETDLLICGRRDGRLRRSGGSVLLGQEARVEGHRGRQGGDGPLRRGGDGPLGHQPVRGPQQRQQHAEGLLRLRAQRPDGHHPRGPGGQHRAPRGLDGPPVREVGPADLEGRGRQVRPRGSLAADDQRRVVQDHRGRGRQERPGRGRRRVLRARLHHPPADGRRQVRGRDRVQRPREQGVRVQGQGDDVRHGRRGARVQAAFDR